MRRALLILAFAALILLGSVVTGPGKTGGNIALMANPMQYPVPAYLDISGIFLRR
jgi:hypothetical protein